MSMHRTAREFSEFNSLSTPGETTLLTRLLSFLTKMLSGAKGAQGGWESGARGL